MTAICLSCGEDDRSPDNLRNIVAQFADQLFNEWRAHDSKTFCNFFAQVVTAALQCPIPQALANDQGAWLQTISGRSTGWEECEDEEEAAEAASKGLPVLVTYYNPTGHGHVGVGVPNQGTDKGLHVAQAGAWCSLYIKASDAKSFGNLPRRYWRHA